VRGRDRRSGVVLLVVLFFALLLTSTIATFARRATVDALVARNRDAVGQAEALARGGVELATALLLDDRVRERQGDLPLDTHRDAWYRVRFAELPAGDGAELRLVISDAGALLNLNALFDPEGGGPRDERTEPFLHAFLEKVIEEMDVPPGEKVYRVRELTDHLLDWVDEDDVRRRGGPEDAFYQEQESPYRAADRPLLSLEELRLVEGFDEPLVEALRPYVTVHPWTGGGGVNPNTAPPHVLALLFFDDGRSLRLADEEVVRRLLRVRQERDGLLCPERVGDELCTPFSEIVRNAVYPPPAWQSSVFRVEARARVGDVRRSVEAVIDRSQGSQPLLLSWRVH